MRLISAKYLFEQGIKNIWKNKIMAFASFCVLLVSLLLVGFSLLFYFNITSIIGGIEGKNQAIVYLDENITDEEIIQVQNSLNNIENIDSVIFYSKEEAWIDLKATMTDASILFESLGDDNPLVDAFKIKVQNIENISDTVTQINQIDGVYHTKAPYDFAEILMGLNRVITLISTSIIAALILVCMVIISNATKASVFARRKEISIMKYVGATNVFIRIPFFIEGMTTGIISGLVATFVTWFAYDSLMDILMTEVSLINIFGANSLMKFDDISLIVCLSYVIAGAFLGAIGSTISTRKHLKV